MRNLKSEFLFSSACPSSIPLEPRMSLSISESLPLVIHEKCYRGVSEHQSMKFSIHGRLTSVALGLFPTFVDCNHELIQELLGFLYGLQNTSKQIKLKMCRRYWICTSGQAMYCEQSSATFLRLIASPDFRRNR